MGMFERQFSPTWSARAMTNGPAQIALAARATTADGTRLTASIPVARALVQRAKRQAVGAVIMPLVLAAISETVPAESDDVASRIR